MIEVKNLTKQFGARVAVNDIGFTIASGEIVGFLGPNGAGKTTTMNMLTGYMGATCGHVSIGGFDMATQPEKAKSHIGYLPDVPPLYVDMLVDEYLGFVADLKRVPKSQKKAMIASVKETVHMSDMSKRLIKNLSKGYRGRLGLAQALMGDPKVLILDEPMVGLDPKQIIDMREVIQTLGQKHTVLLSSHILSEVSAVCDRVMIMRNGSIVASDTPQGLSRALSQGGKILVRLRGEKAAIEAAIATEPLITTVDFVAQDEPNTWDVALGGADGTDVREAVFYAMSKHDLPILSMKSMDLSLEEIFLQLTGGDTVDSHH